MRLVCKIFLLGEAVFLEATVEAEGKKLGCGISVLGWVVFSSVGVEIIFFVVSCNEKFYRAASNHL